MKTKQILTLLLWVAGPGWVLAQDFSEKITREFTFEKKGTNNTILLANINGDIKITGYEGDKILLEVNKKVTAKTQERLEKGKKEIQLGVIDRADTLIFYVEGGCNNFGKLNSRNNRHDDRQEGWGYNWNDCNGRGNNCRTEFDYTMDFVLKVPASVNLLLSTVNDGDITVINGTEQQIHRGRDLKHKVHGIDKLCSAVVTPAIAVVPIVPPPFLPVVVAIVS